MVGPILAQELLLGSRRNRQQWFRRIYTSWLLLQLVFFYFLYLIDANVIGNRIFGSALNLHATSEFAASFAAKLIYQLLLLLLLATPAFTAGAITDEKASGTLQYLLAADLTSWEIILGKLLGRTAQVAMLALATLPVLCFIGVFGGLNLFFIVSLFVVTIAPLFALGAASLLASVWSKQTRDAVLGVYLGGIGAFFVLRWLDWLEPFDPIYVLDPAWGDHPDVKELLQRLLFSALGWGGVGMVCLTLAAWRLRAVYVKQLEGAGRPKKVRWWRARRAPVSEEPIRWKERHVEGLAPLAVLRRIPRWVGIAVVFVTTCFSSLSIIYVHLKLNLTLPELLATIAHLDLAPLASIGPVTDAFIGQGFVTLLIATLIVGLRCSGAVTGERERQTWEAVLLTPLPAPLLVRGKLWGIIGASYPYLFAYAIPAVLFSLLGGLGTVFWTALLLALTFLAMVFVGAAGVWCSVRSKSSWRSLLATALFGYLGGFLLYGVAVPVAGIIYLVILLTLFIIDTLSQNRGQLATIFSSMSGVYVVATCLALIGAFILATSLFLSSAQKYIAFRDRIRHWKEEPRRSRFRRLRRRPLVSDQPG